MAPATEQMSAICLARFMRSFLLTADFTVGSEDLLGSSGDLRATLKDGVGCGKLPAGGGGLTVV